MKKAILLLALGIFALPRAGWERVTDYNGYIDLNSVSFPNAQYGWVAGTEQYNATGSKRNYMAYTRDGGATWTQVQDAPSSGPIYFLDNNNGFAGETTNLIKSVDGGLTWDSVSRTGMLKKIFFVSPDTGYAVSTYYVLRTEDGGATWPIKVLTGPQASDITNGNFMDASFINPNVGWFVWRDRYTAGTSHDRSRIYSTVDGGDSWNANYSYGFSTIGNSQQVHFKLRSIHFFNENDGYIGGDSGFFARTTNGGETWDLRSFDNSYGGIKKILFVNSTAGWILAENKLAMTLDGGNTWEEVSITGVNIKTCTEIFFSDANHGWLIGGGNLICRTTDNGGHPQPVSVNPSARVRRQPSSAFGIRQLPNRGGRARIAYRLSADAALSLAVYDLKGVKTAFAPKRGQSAGEHEFSFKAPKGFYIMEARIHTKTGELKFAEKILVR